MDRQMPLNEPDFVKKNVNYRLGEMDERMVFTTKLLEDAPLNSIDTILDIGMGRGEFSLWFANKGKKVVGTGLYMDSYNLSDEVKNNKNITTVECGVEKMPFEDNSFDAVLLSHVLEHCFNISTVLQEIRRVLKKDGYLFVFVPEYTNFVTASHAVTNWNVGQLLITLLLNGFNVKDGMFLHKEHQVCAFVQRSERELPILRRDSGDTHTLYKEGFFPEVIKFSDKNFETFDGNISSINWDTEAKQEVYFTKKQKLIINISKLIPKKVLRSFLFYLQISHSTLTTYWFNKNAK